MFSRLMSLRVAAVALILPFVSACGGDAGTGPGAVAGSYDLATVDGQALPYVEQGTDENGPYTFKLTSSSILLGSDSKMTRTTSLSFTQAGTTDDLDVIETGKYAFKGGQVLLITTLVSAEGLSFPVDPDTVYATAGTNMLTIAAADTLDTGEILKSTLVYRK